MCHKLYLLCNCKNTTLLSCGLWAAIKVQTPMNNIPLIHNTELSLKFQWILRQRMYNISNLIFSPPISWPCRVLNHMWWFQRNTYCIVNSIEWFVNIYDDIPSKCISTVCYASYVRTYYFFGNLILPHIRLFFTF